MWPKDQPFFSVGKRQLIWAGGLDSRISNACTSTDPGGGGLAASTRTNKPAWVLPVVNPRQPCWSPSGQSYPPLSHHQVTQEWIVDWYHLRPRFLRLDEIWDKCGPLDREKVSEEARPVRLNNEMSGGVAVALNPPTIVPENVDVSVTPLLGDVGSVLPNVASPMVAEGAPLADLVGVSLGCGRGGGGGVSRLLWLSWLSLYHRWWELRCLLLRRAPPESRFDLHSRVGMLGSSLVSDWLGRGY